MESNAIECKNKETGFSLWSKDTFIGLKSFLENEEVSRKNIVIQKEDLDWTLDRKSLKNFNAKLPFIQDDSKEDYGGQANPDFIKRIKNGAILNENWDKVLEFQGKVLSFNTENVVVECCLSPSSKYFESRSFPRILFNLIDNLTEGFLVYIKIKLKPGSIKIDIYNGYGMFDPEIFSIREIWKDFDIRKLGKPTAFK
jgi:hypothetical protein